jgi:AraC-like DNA-binding protein
MSRVTLARHFQERLGRSAAELLTDIRMNLAANELKNTSASQPPSQKRSALSQGRLSARIQAKKQITVGVGRRSSKNVARTALEERRLLKRLMVQHREMGRTIIEMENLRADGEPKSNLPPRTLGRSRGPDE